MPLHRTAARCFASGICAKPSAVTSCLMASLVKSAPAKSSSSAATTAPAKLLCSISSPASSHPTQVVSSVVSLASLPVSRRALPAPAFRSILFPASRTWQDVRLFPSLDLAENIAAADPSTSVSLWMALFRPRRTRHQAAAARKAASETLASLGLTGRDTSSADRISLGQSKRVAIARALQTRAPILFLDEPLAGLDADGIRDVLDHLRELATCHSVALVIIEHALHLPRILDFASTVWTLSHGSHTIESPAAVLQELATARPATGIHSLIRQAIDREVPVTTQSLPQGARLHLLAHRRPHSLCRHSARPRSKKPHPPPRTPTPLRRS